MHWLLFPSSIGGFYIAWSYYESTFRDESKNQIIMGIQRQLDTTKMSDKDRKELQKQRDSLAPTKRDFQIVIGIVVFSAIGMALGVFSLVLDFSKGS